GAAEAGESDRSFPSILEAPERGGGSRISPSQSGEDFEEDLAEQARGCETPACAARVGSRRRSKEEESLSPESAGQRRPVEEPLVTVQPVARHRVAAVHGVDEVENDVAGDQVLGAEHAVDDVHHNRYYTL